MTIRNGMRGLALLLTLVLAISLFPVAAIAAPGGGSEEENPSAPSLNASDFTIVVSQTGGGISKIENNSTVNVVEYLPATFIVQNATGYDVAWSDGTNSSHASRWEYTPKMEGSTAIITCKINRQGATSGGVTITFNLNVVAGEFSILSTATSPRLSNGDYAGVVGEPIQLTANIDTTGITNTIKYRWTYPTDAGFGAGTPLKGGQAMQWTPSVMGTYTVSCVAYYETTDNDGNTTETIVGAENPNKGVIKATVQIRGKVELSSQDPPFYLNVNGEGEEITAKVTPSTLTNARFIWQYRRVDNIEAGWKPMPERLAPPASNAFSPASPDGKEGEFEFACEVRAGSGTSAQVVDFVRLNNVYHFYSVTLTRTPSGDVGVRGTVNFKIDAKPSGSNYSVDWKFIDPAGEDIDLTEANTGLTCTLQGQQLQEVGTYRYSYQLTVDGNTIATHEETAGTFQTTRSIGDITAYPTNGMAAAVDGMSSESQITLTANVTPSESVNYQWQYRRGSTGSYQNASGANRSTYSVPVETTPGVVWYQCVITPIGSTTTTTLSAIPVYFYQLGMTSKAFGQTETVAVDSATKEITMLTGQSLELNAVNGSDDRSLNFPDATYTWSVGNSKIDGYNDPNYELADGGRTLRIKNVTASQTQFTCEVRDLYADSIILGQMTVTVKAEQVYPTSSYGSTLTTGAPAGGAVTLGLSKSKNGEFLEKQPAGFEKFEWKCSPDMMADPSTYSPVPGTSAGGSMNATAPGTSVGTQYYRCFITTNKYGVLVTDPVDVTFFELKVDRESVTGFWDKNAQIQLNARLNPEANTAGYTYKWTISGAAENGFTDTSTQNPFKVSPQRADKYNYECTVTSPAGWTITTSADDSSFVLFDGTATWSKRSEGGEPTDSPDTFLESNKSIVDLEATILPVSEASNVNVQWKYLRTDVESLDTEAKPCTTTTDSQQLKYADTRQSAGIYQYSCELSDKRTGAVLAVIPATPENAVWYGVDMNEVPDFYEYGKVVTLSGRAVPAPGAVNLNGYEYAWYDATTTPRKPLETGNGVYITNVPDSTGASIRDIDGLSPSEYKIQCVAKDGNGNEIVGEVTVRVYYDLKVDILTPAEERLAGRELMLRANVTPDRQVDYRWTKVGDNGAPVTTTSQTYTIQHADRGEQEYQCELVLSHTNTRVGIGTTGSFTTGFRVPVSVQPGTSTEGMAGVGQEVRLTVDELPNEEQPIRPTYQWQIRDNSTGEWTTEQRNAVFTRIPEDTLKREYRCLLGSNGDYPTKEEDAAAVSQTISVTGYQIQIDNAKQDETIAAGSAAELTANILPSSPSGQLSYQWQEYTATGWVNCNSQGSTSQRFQAIPLDGGIHEYRCVVTLPGGATIESPSTEVKAKQSKYTVTITTDPVGTTFPLNKAFSLVASINKNPEDKIVSYEWQELRDAKGWKPITRDDANEERLTFLPNEEGTFYYRCVIAVEDTEARSAETIKTASNPFEITVGANGATVDPNKPWGGGSSPSSSSGNKDFPLLSGAPFTITSTQPYRIKGISAAKKGIGVTVQQVLSSFAVREADGQRVQMVDKNGKIKAPTDFVFTGDVVELIGPNNSPMNNATAVVSGDVLGNGQMQLSQLVKMAKAMKDNSLTDHFLEAGDWDNNGSIGLSDLVVQAKQLKN